MPARKYESICSQLEEEKTKLAQTKHFFEEFKVKAQLEKEKAARLAQSRQDALESEWKEKMHGAEQDVSSRNCSMVLTTILRICRFFFFPGLV